MSAQANGQSAVTEEIRTRECPRCLLCGDAGELLYQGLRDRLFGAVGNWSLKKCSNSQCGLIWLDPMPLKEDIVKAYAHYYTHGASSANGSVGLAKSFYRRVKHDYIAHKYGYGPAGTRGSLGNILKLFPLKRREADAQVRTLSALPGGKILDVGCGTGEWLSYMRDLGWAVEGVEFDSAAAAIAKERGLKVWCGSLREQNLPSASYDAITLNHVIEHVPDPIETLSECRRLLRTGGRLVISTPNSASLSHKIFGPNWRGLEPPRHLHVFSMGSLRKALEKAGFKSVTLIAEVASSVIYESVLLRRDEADKPAAGRPNLSTRTLAWFFNRIELLLIGSKPFVADCMTAVATNV